MPTIWEIDKSQSGEQGEEKQSQSLWYMVALYPGETILDAISIVRATTPDAVADLDLQKIRWQPVEGSGGLVIEFEVPYGNVEPKKPEQKEGEDEITFDAGITNEKRYYSIQTVSYARAGENAPDFRGGINVTKNNVEGVDIAVPNEKFSITRVFKSANILRDYVQKIREIVGKVNSNEVTLSVGNHTMNFYFRELRFDGFRMQKKSAVSEIFTYNFSVSRSQYNFPIGIDRATGLGTIGVAGAGGGRVIPTKLGWDYLWVDFEEKEDSTPKVLVQVPRSVHVEQVYEQADFRVLGI